MALVKAVSGECGLGVGGSVRSLSRKRISIRSNNLDVVFSDLSCKAPKKRRYGGAIGDGGSEEQSLLEAVPQDVLIKVLSGVDHEDLKQLFHVSRLIREETMFVRTSHFAYITPSKIRGIQGSTDLQNPEEVGDDLKAPNAPKQSRALRSQLGRKQLEDVSVALFT
ncbi:hypothetical protein Nepgr_017709 [Nepenthes gracilis]|uniref:F-box domain-containing protein n=1 Tax=Nepenthes gracilis TaxID=150966 RepID=A0AAD3XSR0_NEPGR|nr:hypothetical protein Nepgr_017709 [Nepenthes gracilis]